MDIFYPEEPSFRARESMAAKSTRTLKTNVNTRSLIVFFFFFNCVKAYYRVDFSYLCTISLYHPFQGFLVIIFLFSPQY